MRIEEYIYEHLRSVNAAEIGVSRSPPPSRSASADRHFPRLPAPDADGLLNGENEDLAVTDVARPRTFDDGIHRGLHVGVVHADFQTDLLQQRADLLHSAVDFGDPLLPPAAQDVRHRLEVDLLLVQLAHHVVELVRLDNG